MDKQDVFNRVVAHARTMTELSMVSKIVASYQCQYRTNSGNKCFIGSLIEDKHYDKHLEGCVAHDPPVLAALKQSGIMVDPWSYSDLCFLDALQRIHDQAADAKEILPEGEELQDIFEHKLFAFAAKYNLTMPDCDVQ